MNWSKAQDKELYTVILFDSMATDEDKVAAGNELLSRIGGEDMGRCSVRGCSVDGNKSWARIPVCEEHHKAISKETALYYKGKIKNSDRVIYNGIRHHKPKGKALMRL